MILVIESCLNYRFTFESEVVSFILLSRLIQLYQIFFSMLHLVPPERPTCVQPSSIGSPSESFSSSPRFAIFQSNSSMFYVLSFVCDLVLSGLLTLSRSICGLQTSLFFCFFFHFSYSDSSYFISTCLQVLIVSSSSEPAEDLGCLKSFFEAFFFLQVLYSVYLFFFCLGFAIQRLIWPVGNVWPSLSDSFCSSFFVKS